MLRTCQSLLTTIAFALLIAAGTTTWGQTADGDKDAKRLRVGVFDSRAVAVAYAASAIHAEKQKPLLEEYKKAKAAGDQEAIKRLEAEGKARQDQLHQQGFGTASVAGLLESVKDELPRIARENNVDLIVSKWDIVYQVPGTETVDITDAIVKPFHPSERTLKIINDLKNHAPVPLEKLKNLKSNE